MFDLNKIIARQAPRPEKIKEKINAALETTVPEISPAEIAGLTDWSLLADEQSVEVNERDLTNLRAVYSDDADFRFAGVCVYPNFLELAKNYLKNSKTKVVAVTGNFPTGQTRLKAKLTETRMAIDSGADEVDYVVDRTAIIDKQYEKLAEELMAVKGVCGATPLKVILETGALPDLKAVQTATAIAIGCGVQFVKTSTGKTAVGATFEAVWVILNELRRSIEEGGAHVGIKISGGISSRQLAKQYIRLTQAVLGNQWVDTNSFRLGAGAFGMELLKLHQDKKNKQ